MFPLGVALLPGTSTLDGTVCGRVFAVDNPYCLSFLPFSLCAPADDAKCERRERRNVFSIFFMFLFVCLRRRQTDQWQAASAKQYGFSS